MSPTKWIMMLKYSLMILILQRGKYIQQLIKVIWSMLDATNNVTDTAGEISDAIK